MEQGLKTDFDDLPAPEVAQPEAEAAAVAEEADAALLGDGFDETRH